MKIIGLITLLTALGTVGVAAPASANGSVPGLCGVTAGKGGGLEMIACERPASRPTGRLMLRLDPPARARRAVDPLGTGELGRRQLNDLLASL